jgi:hypothetical protein
MKPHVFAPLAAMALTALAPACAEPNSFDLPDAQADVRSPDASGPSPDAGASQPATADGPMEQRPVDGSPADAPPADVTPGPADAAVRDAAAPPTPDAANPYPDDGLRPNRMFTTSQSYSSALGGLAGADAKCQERARAAGLPGTFVALLSTTTVDARSRLGQSRGWIRTDGRPFADTAAALFQSTLFYPPMLDELGRTIEEDISAAFTGSNADGTRDGLTDWGTEAALTCSVGLGYGGGRLWLYLYRINPCNISSYRLYCFETGRNVAVSPTAGNPTVTRTAFVSKATFSPASGLAAADTLCSGEATAAGLTGRFKALLATSSGSAISRFDLNGPPWVRPDGLRIVDSARDITRTVLAPLEVEADRAIAPRNLQVWTGAETVDGPATDTCKDWTSASSADVAVGGASSKAGYDWFAGSGRKKGAPISCDRAAAVHLYCFQE